MKHGLTLVGELHAIKFRDDTSDYGDLLLRQDGRLNGVSIGIRRDLAAQITATPGQTIAVEVSTPRMATSKAGNRYMQWYVTGVVTDQALPASPPKAA